MGADRRDQEAFAWVEQQLGGSIVSRVRDSRWRPQWFLEVDVAGEAKSVVLRGFRNPGYTTPDEAGSRAALASEAQVLTALQGVPVRVPAFYGHNVELGWLAMERLPGDSELTGVADHDERFAAYQEYMAALAQLHAFPLDQLDLGDMTRPASAREFKDDLRERHEAIFRASRLPLPEPVMELGYRWLADNELPSERPLCLGLVDVGPNQFMFDGPRFSGFIDVEFGMVVDPLMEIGMMRSRELTYHIGDLPSHLEHYGRCYEDLTGIAFDREALQFWTIAGPTLFNTFTLPAVQQPSATMQDAVFVYAFEVQQKRGLLEGLAERYGFTLDRPELTAGASTMLSPLHDLLIGQLEQHYGPRATTEADAAFVRYSRALAQTLARGHAAALTIDRDNVAELAELLGHYPEDWNQGLAALQTAIAEDYGHELDKRVNFLYRVEVRREHLLEPLQRATGVSVGEPMARLDARAAEGCEVGTA